MGVLGVELRRRRLGGAGGRAFLLALDHGLPAGPLRGIEDLPSLLRALRDAPLTGVIVNPGIVRHVASDLGRRRGLVVHLSAGTVRGSHPNLKVPSGSVAAAVALGADAVSVQIHFGDAGEERMLATAGRIAHDARSFGMPTLAMAYPPSKAGTDVDIARHAVRAAAEIGADIVLTNYVGPAESTPELVDGCPVPLLVTGGAPSSSPDAFLDRLRESIAGGAAGVAVGRRLFQHANPRAFATQIGEAIFRGASPEVEVEVRA